MDRPLSSAIAKVRREFPSLLALSFFINMLALTLPLYCMQIFTRVLDSGSGETLLVLTFLAVFALAVFGYLTWLRTKWLALMADRFDSGLSAPIQTAAILENARGRVRSSSEGMRDLATLRSAISGGEARGLFDLPWAPFFFLVLYLLHPAFFFVTLAGALLLLALAIANYLHARPILKEATTNSAASHNAGISMARNSEALMGMRMMRDAVTRWSGLHGKSVASQSDALQRSGGYMAIAQAMRLILQVTIFGVGAYLVIQHNASAGLMIAAVFLAQRALAPFETAIASVRSTINGLAAYRRLDRLLDDKYEVATDKMRLPAPLGAITATNLVKMSPDGSRMILKGISFQIPSGAVLGIVGASASGKTTLAKVLVGVWKADKGVVRLDGAKIEDWRDDELSQYVGYLPQDVELFPGTVRDNIARLGMPDDEAVIEAAKAAGCHELILHLPQAYDTEVGDGGIFLSGGQRQRIALARALYRRPKLIVLDEPNSNLDAFGESALVAAIKRAQGWGATVIIVVHRPSLLRDATFILALNDGHLQMFGSPQEVLPRLTTGGPAPARIITGRTDDSQAASAAGAAP